MPRIMPRDRATPKCGILLTGFGILLIALEVVYFFFSLLKGSFSLEAVIGLIYGTVMLIIGLLLLRYSIGKGAFGPYWRREDS